MDGRDSKEKQEIYSSTVRAGRRTYFFDVKKTRKGDLYLTVTESKKVFDNNEGAFHFEKHKLFLYKEDFEKFEDALSDAVKFIKANLDDYMIEDKNNLKQVDHDVEKVNKVDELQVEAEVADFADVEFEDLDK